MERDFIEPDGDVTVIASHTKKSVEIWSIGEEKKITCGHIDIGIREAFRIPENFSTTWNSSSVTCEKIQVGQMIWEGCPNGD